MMIRDGLVGPGRSRMNFDNSRGRIAEFYGTRLEHLFTPEARDIVHPQNRTIVSRLGETP